MILTTVATVIVSLYTVQVTSGLAAFTAVPYKEYDLAKICGKSKTKQSLYLHNQAHRFTFNSVNKDLFSCHLELHLSSEHFGFSIFIQSMKLESNNGCSRDFLQFGRDFIVFTSHKSQKKCGVIEPLQSQVFTNTSQRLEAIKRREYIEATDKEMDIWLSIYPPASGQPHKELNLVVTPFKKKCYSDDSYYRKCPGSSKCIKRELFCDGFINCDGDPKDEQEEFCLVNSSLSNVDMFLSIPIIILIVIFVLLVVMFIIFLSRHFYIALKRKNCDRGGESERRALQDPPTSSPRSCNSHMSGISTRGSHVMPPSAPAHLTPSLPPHPPSYSEAMGSEYKDDPPKYSEVPEEAHTVIYKQQN